MQLSRTVDEPLRRRQALWGSADAQDGVSSATEVITHRLGKSGVDDVRILLPLVLLDPHLQHVSV
jgi:hypothetical protein